MCVQSGGIGFVLWLEIGDKNLGRKKKTQTKLKTYLASRDYSSCETLMTVMNIIFYL